MTVLEQMLAELESNLLEVILAPSKRRERDWDMIRVAARRNCNWYRAFCARHSSDRIRRNSLFDTRIKRRSTVRALNQLIAGKPAGKYAAELLEIAATHDYANGCLRRISKRA